MATRAPIIDEQPADAAGNADGSATAPVVIKASGVEKTFRIPDQRIDSFKERATHPLRRIEYRTMRALQDVSFDVHKGEFFGIVGRNGSGKSTLLKILASIYRADSGSIKTAGRVAPFIELGVGFNPELTARENVVLNGVLMGLTRRDAQGRLDAVIEFAELEEFIDLKLKNYSSGMMVRLAFSVMVQADADIMLIDEVLAVGDAAFAQKCMDVFHRRREEGKTVVLVTHDMETVQSLCHRAMLLHEGKLVYIGDPEATALRYYRLNFAGIRSSSLGPGDDPSAVKDVNMDLLEATLRDEQGRPIENLEQDKPITIDLLLQAKRDLPNPIFVVWVRNAEHVVVFEFTRIMDGPVRAGERVRFSGPIENKLVPGRYYLDCWIRQDESDNVMALQALRAVNFVVYGTASRHGVVTVDAQIEPRLEQ